MTSEEKKPGLERSTSEKEKSGVDPSTSEERSLVDRSMSIDGVLPKGDVPFDRYSESSDESQLSKSPPQEVRILPEIGRGSNWNAAKQHFIQYLPYVTNENNGGRQNEIKIHDETGKTLKDEQLARRMDGKRRRTAQMHNQQITLCCMPDCLVRGLTRVVLIGKDHSIGLCICGLGVLFMIFLVALIWVEKAFA
ncbi:hypothetical protein TKK_0002059 [Trichogramma kaykai]|uniref:Uncharacterized protein n=1 Tax=Trichogramma kaykai TaxID=54128 RepID=A0ABD2X8J7_9HYME